MDEIKINYCNFESVRESCDKISFKLFSDYQLQVNNSYYRLVDIEFYYFAEGIHEDIYAHKHETQLQTGKWYFHGSGIDITIGNGKHHGGVLIRGIVKISGESNKQKRFIEKEIHGPLNVKSEICSNLNDVFEGKPNIFNLQDISGDRMNALMEPFNHMIKTRRIGLNPDNDKDGFFYNAKLRYVIFPHLKLKDKTIIAYDMQEQFPSMSKEEINKELGSVFLK